MKGRVHDLALATSLGYSRPTLIRKLIRRWKLDLAKYGELKFIEVPPPPRQGGRTSTNYYLNKEQASFIIRRADLPIPDKIKIKYNIEVHIERRELPIIKTLMTVFKEFMPQRQACLGDYRIDLLLPEKLAIECDEEGHTYGPLAERDRQKDEYIRNKLNIPVLRFRPHHKDFSLPALIRIIMLYLYEGRRIKNRWARYH